jgi:hypothetical protein
MNADISTEMQETLLKAGSVRGFFRRHFLNHAKGDDIPFDVWI